MQKMQNLKRDENGNLILTGGSEGPFYGVYAETTDGEPEMVATIYGGGDLCLEDYDFTRGDLDAIESLAEDVR